MLNPKTNAISAAIFAIAVLLGASDGAHAAQEEGSYLIPMHRMYTGPGKAGLFHLRDNQKKSIINLTRPQHFRICVERGSHYAGAVVSYDGKQSTVEPGECHDFEAAVITVAPPKPLAEGFEIHGSFHTFSWAAPLLDQQ